MAAISRIGTAPNVSNDGQDFETGYMWRVEGAKLNLVEYGCVMTTSLAWRAEAGVSVLGRLEERSAALANDSLPGSLRTRSLRLASRSRPWETSSDSSSGPSVLAFLFALPDSVAMKAIDRGGDYFTVRTGETWDLFLPGYVRQEDETARAERVGDRFARRWSFDPVGFDAIRGHVQSMSGGRWYYSGGSDLVLVNTWLSLGQDPVIDWTSTASGSLTDTSAGVVTLGIGQVIERISRDLQENLEDPMYGVGAINSVPHRPSSPSLIRDLFVSVTGEIVAGLAAKSAGL